DPRQPRRADATRRILQRHSAVRCVAILASPGGLTPPLPGLTCSNASARCDPRQPGGLTPPHRVVGGIVLPAMLRSSPARRADATGRRRPSRSRPRRRCDPRQPGGLTPPCCGALMSTREGTRLSFVINTPIERLG